MRLATLLCLLVSGIFLTACSTSFLKYEKTDQLKKIEEFDEAVKIVRPEPTPEPQGAAVADTTSVPAEPAKVAEPSVKKEEPAKKKVAEKTPPKKVTKKGKKGAVTKEPELTHRQPDIEDQEGFANFSRRPINDPFRVGEEVVHNVHYFKVSAGELRMKVEPYAMVNNRKSYTFVMEIKTSSLFNAFYSVEDRMETFVDFEDLVPRVFQLHVKESGQLREAKMLFDSEKNVATFWEKKVTKESGEEEKRQQWDILPYSQNVYSAVYYMRNFAWETGKEYSFRVANDNENLVFSGKALRREVLDTALGPMKAIVIQPNIVLKGKFKPIGDNFIWLSDDDRKYVLRIESKIKIGTLVSEVVSINPGK